MTVQDTFVEDIPLGYAGMEADGELSNTVSRHLEGNDAAPFGAPMYRGAGDRGVVLTVSANFVGFAVSRKGMPVTADRAADTFAPGDTLPVKERGKIWVNSSTVANKGEPVYVTPAGLITNSSGGNTAAPEWEFDDTIAVAGLVRVVRR